MDDEKRAADDEFAAAVARVEAAIEAQNEAGFPVYLREGAAKAACAAAKADGRSLSDWLHGLIWAAVLPDEVDE